MTEPEALAIVWQHVNGDTAALNQLICQSQRLRDQRLLEATLTVLADAPRPEAVRIAAIRTL